DILEDCLDGVKLGKFHACTVFSPNMAIGNEAQNIITIKVDESRMNLATMIESTIQKKVSAETTKISEGLTGNIVATMFNAKDVLKEKREVVINLLGSTSDSILKVSGIKEDLAELDLVYDKSEINFTDIRRDYGYVKDEINGTAACLAALPLDDPIIEELDKSINYLETGIENLVSKFDAILGTKESSMGELDNIKETLQTGTDDLNTLRNVLGALVAGIEGVEVTDIESIVSPVQTKVESVTAKKTHLGYMFPTFIVLILMFISLLLATTVTIREKLSKAFFRNFIVPSSDFLFMIGGYLTNILIVILQLVILFGAAIFFLPELKGVLFSLFLVLLVIASVFILMGMFIGFIFKSEETATLGAISIGSLMLFFSNTILPIETLPTGIREIARLNPFVLGVSVLKRIMLFGANFSKEFSQISLEVYMLICFAAIFFVLAFVAREVLKSRMR
ncbi:MAG: ABC transporter permease, partial [Nanoarchaeota archaeon]|nr:ABC transporter permease [Nanoarchaeota archaeon]